jgi:hypothetical protein
MVRSYVSEIKDPIKRNYVEGQQESDFGKAIHQLLYSLQDLLSYLDHSLPFF